jgi:hypothetical protein
MHVNAVPIVCPQCLALLCRVAGEQAYRAQQRARARFLRRGRS